MKWKWTNKDGIINMIARIRRTMDTQLSAKILKK
jgi:hypothetical protein